MCPNVFIQYWSMRVMAYLAALVLLLALWGAWAVWRHRLEQSRWFLLVATWVAIAPFLMNTAGWLLTENGRQPWIVQGLLQDIGRGITGRQRHVDLDHPDPLHRWSTASSPWSTESRWSATDATAGRSRGRRAGEPGPDGTAPTPTRLRS